MAWSFFLLSACATEPAAAPAATAPAPAASPTRARPEGDAKTFEGTVGVTDVAFSGTESTVLTDVKANDKGALDHVVFTFEGALPGYHLAYLDSKPVHCASGEPLAVAGDAWLEVRFTPSAAHTAAGKPTLAFQELPFDFAAVRELQQVCDYEGVVTWVVGLKARNAYRVVERKDPPRLAIDIQR